MLVCPFLIWLWTCCPSICSPKTIPGRLLCYCILTLLFTRMWYLLMNSSPWFHRFHQTQRFHFKISKKNSNKKITSSDLYPDQTFPILPFHLLSHTSNLLYPILSCPTLFYFILLYTAQSYPILLHPPIPYYPVLSFLILYRPSISHPTLSHLFPPYAIHYIPSYPTFASNHIMSYPILFYPTISYPVTLYPLIFNYILCSPGLFLPFLNIAISFSCCFS